jgi:hypothetical protein
MERLKQNPQHKSMNLIDLNKITLQTLRDIIKTKYLSGTINNKIVNKENYLERDSQLYSNRKTIYGDNINFNQNTQLNEETNEVVLQDFNKINEERKEKSKEEVEKENILESDNIDQSMSQEDFQNSLDKLQEYRNKLMEEQLETNQLEQDNSKTNFKNQLTMSTSDFMNDRNQLIRDQFSDIGKIDPKQIYIQSEKIQDIEQNAIVNRPINNIGPSFPFIKKPTTNIVKEKFICINSMDRDWIVQKNRYSYLVKFNYVNKSIKKIEIYQNNPTIPYTKSTLSEGIPNLSGFYFQETNSNYPAYNVGTSLGNIIGYETVEVLVDDTINIQQNFKNIQSIEVTKVIIPADITNAITGRLYNFNLNYPYVLLHIDEFNDVYEGTDDSIRRSFCQLIYENFYQSSNGRGYIVLKPVQGEKKIFHPSLLSTMPSLNISIRDPNGDLLNDSIDGYSILMVSYEPFNRTYLKIVTNEYFDKNEFFSGDKIHIKKYCAFTIDETQDSQILIDFNNFINRDSGHIITNIGDASDNSFYKSFYIKAPGTFSSKDGVFTIEQTQIDNLVIFNCKNTTINIDPPPANGYVLNMSLQNSISMKLTTVNFDSANLVPEML